MNSESKQAYPVDGRLRRTISSFPDMRNPVIKTGAISVGACIVPQIILGFAAGDKWATAYLWSVASLATGAILGFLFGVPKVLQDETTKSGGYRQLVNTNLDQISDWLTKVVVGLTLVNARDISMSVQNAGRLLARSLGDENGAFAIAMAVMVYFSVLGFMSIYILTRLYLSPAFSEVEQALQRVWQSLVAARESTTLAEAKLHLDESMATLQPLWKPDAAGTTEKPTALDASETGETVDMQNSVDGCDVPKLEATLDRDLPAADGGVER